MSPDSSFGRSPARRLPALPARRRFAAAMLLAPWVLPGPAVGAPTAQPPDRGDFPNALLLNQNRQPVRFYDDLVRGDHTVVINFMYAQCADICPMTTANLARVQALLGERLGREVRLASISLDPLRDTPAILKAYAAHFDAQPGWQFLTGRLKDIELIRRALGVYERDPARDRDRSQHTGMLVYGNQARGRWSRVSALADPQRIFDSITRWT
ncbi:SCO family protein [Polaromonas sp.]|uniref:SCO family protein n=1 Tax=Polaromonas sp. TaxID=1869339 RepID=UPI00286AB1B3|nr:SCO family protein [Polaromonas sp.]